MDRSDISIQKENFGNTETIFKDKIETSLERCEQSLNHSIVSAEQTNNIGTNMLRTLKEQNEKITNVQTNMDSIHNTMQQSERIVHGMESFWNRIWRNFSSGNKKTESDISLEKTREKNEKNIKKIEYQREKNSNENIKNISTTILRSQTNSDDIDQSQKINELSHIVSRLKETSEEINNELQISMIKLDTLSDSIEKADHRIIKTMGKCNKLTK